LSERLIIELVAALFGLLGCRIEENQSLAWARLITQSAASRV